MLKRIIDQMYWANEAMIEWLKEERKETDAHLRLASHILNAETIWICRAKGMEHEKDTFKVLDLPGLTARNEANHRDFLSLFEGDMGRVFDYRLLDGTPGRSQVEDMILHVYSHGFHHRGQMAAMASKAGEKFPNVAHIQFTRTQS